MTIYSFIDYINYNKEMLFVIPILPRVDKLLSTLATTTNDCMSKLSKHRK